MAERRSGRLEVALSPFADVRPGEAASALALGAQAFVLLAVYYLLKPVRESWILPGGAELKTYAAAAQAVGLVFVAKAYDWLARRVRRDRLVALSVFCAVACLVGFHAADRAGLDVGVAFYLWLGAFQLLLVAQLWSFAADIYTAEQGRRLFALLGAGAALGSVLGAQAARLAMRAIEHPGTLLLAAAALLCITPLLAAVAHARAPRVERRSVTLRAAHDGLGRLLADPYLRLLALFTVLLNCVGTVGEYAFDRTLLEGARAALARGEITSVGDYVGAFKADTYAAINLLVLVLQLFAVSRVLRTLGERPALALLPAFVALGAMATLGADAAGLPLLAALVIERVLEGGIQHSIQATARQSFYLFTSEAGRWSGKTFIDTVTWRAGDVLGAVAVAGLAAADAGARGAILCVLLCSVPWLATVRALAREHRAREHGLLATA